MTTRRLQLTARDEALFSDFDRSGGLLDFETIRRRNFPKDTTGKSCWRRLGRFKSLGFIEAIQPMVSFAQRLPGVFRLTPKGADLAEELTGQRPRVVSASASATTLEHRLSIGKFRLLVHDACVLEQLPAPTWIGEYDPKLPAPVSPGAKLCERFVLCHQYAAADEVVTCWPDAAGLIVIPVGEERAPHYLLILLEMDRSTERLAQVKAKLPGYHEFLQRGDDRGLFPGADSARTTRVFFVTPSAERAKNIASEIKSMAGSASVRLAVMKNLTPATFFREPVWFTPSWQAKAILPKPPPLLGTD